MTIPNIATFDRGTYQHDIPKSKRRSEWIVGAWDFRISHKQTVANEVLVKPEMSKYRRNINVFLWVW